MVNFFFLLSYLQIGKPSEKSMDTGLAKKLWDISETVVGLKPEERFL